MVRITALDAQIAVAERALMDATGGQNVCRLDKDGRATGGMKYYEGQLVAMRAARRLAQPGDGALDPAALRGLRDKWRADLQAQQARERPAPPWLAYAQGGVDALEQLVAPAEERDG